MSVYRCASCDVPLRVANSAKETSDMCQACYDEQRKGYEANRIALLRRLIFLLVTGVAACSR